MAASTQQIGNWLLRILSPEGKGSFPVILLLHGWTGDENSMWVFASKLPKQVLFISPRGIYPARVGGYSWFQQQAGIWPSVEDFRPAVQVLVDLLQPQNFPNANLHSINILGFSQGAALAFSFAILFPERVNNLAGLSGFLPGGAEEYLDEQPLTGKSIFMAHGTLDTLVPVQRARSSVSLLKKLGAVVSYCEDEVGHKLSASCFGGLKNFFHCVGD